MVWIVSIAVGALALTTAVAPLTAARKKPNPIFGNVKRRGHRTVVAVAGDGKAAAVRASPFTLVPPARRFRLEVRGPDGSYEGPVVASGSKRRVVVGFKAGARLGPIVQRDGYWVLRRELPARFRDATSTARAVGGVPIGARTLGLVRSPASGPSGRGADQDRDGVPGAFDIDVDGDRLLNSVDVAPSSTAPRTPYRVNWLLSVGLKQSFLADQMGVTHGVAGYALNQNAVSGMLPTAQFENLRDIATSIRGILLFTLPRNAGSVELDCGGLTYCSGPESTGRDATQAPNRRFPQDFDPDHDGFGTMAPTPLPLNPQRDGIGVTERLSGHAKVFVLKPGARHFGDVAAGDTYLERRGRTVQPVMLNFTLGTVPALAAWTDGAVRKPITYPVAAAGEGTSQTPFRSAQYPNGTLTFTVWRPQRRSFPAAGERGDWTDVGHLLYSTAGFLEGLGGDRVWTCPTSAYSTTDPQLQLTPIGLRDRRDDAPVDPTQTLTFSVDIGACLRHSGIDPATAVNTSSAIHFTASSDLGDAAEGGGFSFASAGAGGAGGGGGGAGPDSPFNGTWRFAGGTPGTQLDWTLNTNQFASDHFAIAVYAPYSLVGGTAPPGWTCAVRNLNSVSDMWYCTGSSLTPRTTVAGAVTLSQPGRDDMVVDAIAPKQAVQPGDTGYRLVHGP
jgi:hypothetical protein